jgi:hypothetical protein
VLAYLFWHRPRPGVATEDYEQALAAFHRSLSRTPPVGMLASAALRLPAVPWLPKAAADGGAPGVTGGYEDWYLVEDFAALGVINAAAVGRGHRTSHDHVARWTGAGAGGLYRLLDGDVAPPGLAGVADAGLAVWVERPPGSAAGGLEQLLADGIDPARASLWRRQLVLGPAPELCLLATDVPAGASAARLPGGWTATELVRERLAT